MMSCTCLHSNLFPSACCQNSRSSSGLAVQNAGHRSRVPHLCRRSPQSPLHSHVVRPVRGRRGEEAGPAATFPFLNTRRKSMAYLWLICLLLFHSHLPRFQISSLKKESTPLSSGKVGYAAPTRQQAELYFHSLYKNRPHPHKTKENSSHFYRFHTFSIFSHFFKYIYIFVLLSYSKMFSAKKNLQFKFTI